MFVVYPIVRCSFPGNAVFLTIQVLSCCCVLASWIVHAFRSRTPKKKDLRPGNLSVTDLRRLDREGDEKLAMSTGVLSIFSTPFERRGALEDFECSAAIRKIYLIWTFDLLCRAPVDADQSGLVSRIRARIRARSDFCFESFGSLEMRRRLRWWWSLRLPLARQLWVRSRSSK